MHNHIGRGFDCMIDQLLRGCSGMHALNHETLYGQLVPLDLYKLPVWQVATTLGRAHFPYLYQYLMKFSSI